LSTESSREGLEGEKEGRGIFLRGLFPPSTAWYTQGYEQPYRVHPGRRRMKGLRVLTAEKVRIDDKGEIERNGYFCDGDEIEEINMSRYRIVQELLLGYPPYNKLIYLDDVHYLVMVEPI